MVLSPTERKIICDRKRILRTRALRLEIGVLLQRIERLLDNCIKELGTVEIDEDCGEQLSVGKVG